MMPVLYMRHQMKAKEKTTMKDLENKKALNEVEEEADSGGCLLRGNPKQTGKENVSWH